MVESYTEQELTVPWSEVAAKLEKRTDNQAKRRYRQLLKGLPLGGTQCARNLSSTAALAALPCSSQMPGTQLSCECHTGWHLDANPDQRKHAVPRPSQKRKQGLTTKK